MIWLIVMNWIFSFPHAIHKMVLYYLGISKYGIKNSRQTSIFSPLFCSSVLYVLLSIRTMFFTYGCCQIKNNVCYSRYQMIYRCTSGMEAVDNYSLEWVLVSFWFKIIGHSKFFLECLGVYFLEYFPLLD